MTEGPGLLSGACSKYPTAAPIPHSTEKNTKKKNRSGIRSYSKVQIAAKSEKYERDKVKAGEGIEIDT